MGKLIRITNGLNYNRFTDETVDIDTVNTTGNAEPTSRVLEGSSDHGYAQEWTAPCTLPDGRKGLIVYLFTEEEVVDYTGESREAEDYPWDDNHIRRIKLIY